MISLNGEELLFGTFPNGETNVNGEQIHRLLKDSDRAAVVFKFENDGDLIKLLFLKDCLDEQRRKANLLISYMPYSRMDRKEGNSVFTLKSVTKFINNMNFESVTVIEPHSDVTPALLDRCIVKFPTMTVLNKVVQMIGFDKANDFIFFPDAGAAKRYGKFDEVKGFKQLVGHKQRDFATGKLGNLQVMGSVDQPGFKAVIVDDLSSYGGTFRTSAKELRNLGASEVYLVVTHAENAISEVPAYLLEKDPNATSLLDSGLINGVFAGNTMNVDNGTHPILTVFNFVNY